MSGGSPAIGGGVDIGVARTGDNIPALDDGREDGLAQARARGRALRRRRRRLGFSGKVAADVTRLNLADEQKAALVAFFKTLDGAPLPASLTTAPPRPR